MKSTWNDVLDFLWKNSRFTSYFYQSIRFAEDNTLPTLALTVWSYRAVLFYNKEFIRTLTVDERVGLLVHEMLHVIFSHNHRAIKNEHPHLQNLAQDMVINSYIRKNARSFFSKKIRRDRDVPILKLPEGLPIIPVDFFHETAVEDPSWEQVYHWLKIRGPEILKGFTDGLKENFLPGSPSMDKNAPPDAAEVPLPDTDIDNPEKNRTGQKPEHKDFYVFKNASGDTLPAGSHNLNYEAGKKHLENNLKHVMTLAKKDETTANERFFIEISTIIEKAEKVDAKSFVKKIKTITRQLNTSSDWEYSSERFNRRYFAEGIYSAGRRLKNEKIITVAVDVSASMVMRPESIETAFGAVEALLKDYRIYLVCIDETVFIPEKKEDAFIVSGKKTGNYLYKKGDWKYIRSGNCGTTFFAPLFNDYIRGHSEMLIVITDGEIYDMGTLVKYPKTLWLIPEGCGDDFSPPFGSFAPISNK